MTPPRDDKKTSKGGWTDPAAATHNPFAALAARKETLPAPPAEPPQDDPAPPQDATPARAVLRLEKKGRGGKTVTLVTHLALPPDALDTWCKDLRKELGCGGQVEGDALAFHGDHLDRLTRALTARGVARITRP